jgi:tetratricopeptide (TPR) repeat protein
MNERVRELFDAVVQDPGNEAAARELEALLTSDAQWGPLVDLYVHLAQNASEPTSAAALLRRAGEVAERNLGDPRRAIEIYNAGLGADPEPLVVLGRMRVLLRQLEDWEGWVQVGEAEVERTEDVGARAELIHELGEVLEEKIGDQERAMVCYQAAFQADHRCLRALYAARRIYRQVGNWEMVAQLLDLELQTVEDPDRQAEIFQELGNVLLYDLDQTEMARQCFERYLALRPDDTEMKQQLAELGGPTQAASPEPVVEAAPEPVVEAAPEPVVEAAPEPVFEAAPEPVVEAAPEPVIEAAPEPQPESTPEPVFEAAPEPQPESAPEPVVEAAPEPVVEAAPEPQPEPESAPEPAAETMQAPTPPSLDVGALAARLQSGDGADRLAALEAMAPEAGAFGDFAVSYLSALREVPGDVSVYARVGRRLKAPREVLEAIARGIEALATEFPGAAHALHGERILFGGLHLDEGKTVDLKLRELAKVSGDDPGAREWQIQRLVETGKWRNIQQMLTDAAGGDTPANRTEALRRMAFLAEARSGEPDKATEFWRQVHLADKADRDARQALARLYRAGEKWNAYVEILKLEVEEIPDADRVRKIEALKTLIGVYTQHLNLDAMVVNLYGQVLALDSADPDALRVLAEKYEAMRRWPDLVALLQKQVDTAIDADERIGLNLRIAHLYLDKFRNQAEAIKAYEAVLGDDPGNRTAIENLQDMYEKRREWEKLVAVQRQLADTEADPAARAAKYKEIADNATKKIRRPSISLELWEQVLAIQPGDVDALRALVGLYESEKHWDKMVEAVAALVDRVSDAAERVDLLQKSGVVLQDRLGDREGCVAVWQKLIAIEPEHRRAGESLKKALIELGDWDALSEYFGAREKWDELVRLLDGQVGVQKDDATKIDLLFRTATIFESRLDQKDRAVRALERILQIEPRNVIGARALEPIYEAAHEYRKLAMVLDVLLEHESDAAERFQLMMRSARIYEQHLRNPDSAFEWVRRALQEHPTDVDAIGELERLGGLTHQWSTVHDDLVSALGNAAGDSGAQLRITLTLARILDQNMGQVQDALGRYHDALSIDPENLVALDAVEALYTRLASWHDLLGVIDRKLGLADGVSARKSLLRKQGAIYEEQLDDADSAVEKYRAIVAEDEGDRDALAALHRLFQSGERFEELHDVLQRELQLVAMTGEGDALALKLQLGFIELHALGRTADAISAFRDILEANPTHAEARSALEGLLIDPEFRGPVAKILEPIYHDQGEWEALVRVLEIELEDTAETVKRFELLERIGALHTARTADVDRAFEAFARALREVPTSHVAVSRLAELAEVGQKFGDFALLLEEVIPDAKDDALARALLARLAVVYEERLGDLPRAIDAHTRVLNLEADNRPSIESLERLYARSQMWPELLAIFRRKLELTELPDAREALQFQIGQLLEEMLEDPNEAIVTYREVLEADEHNVRALRALDRLYGALGQFVELAEVVERQLALATDESEKTALRVRLGVLQEGELGNTAQAIETYRTVLSLTPENTEALGALERLLSEPEYQATIADILEPIYRGRDDWEKLVGVYEIQREHADAADRQVELLHRIAELHQNRGGAPDEAFRSYARAFAVEPSNGRTLAELTRIAEALEIWTELVQVYEGLVDDISEPAVATDIHKRVARVQLGQIRDLSGARRHFEAAYAADDTDLECIAALEDIYFQTEQWNELVSVLLRKSELTEEAEAKKDLLFRVSAIFEEMLGDAHRAVEIYRAVLEVDAVDAKALDALERIFLSLGRWEDLLEILHRKAELTEDLAARKDIYYVIGAAYDRELDDLTRAVETYQTVLGWDAQDLTSLQCLDSLYHRLEKWEELRGILVREVAIVSEPEAQVALHFRIANLYETALEQVPTAIEGYRDILAQWPGHEPSLQALEGLIRGDREPVAAMAVLQPVLEKAGAWDRLIAGWRSLLEVTTEVEARTALHMQIGAAFEDMLADSDQAFDAYAEAVKEDATHLGAFSALERVARTAGVFDRLAGLIEQLLGHVQTDAVARDLYLRVARIYEEELGSNVDAIERFRRVREIEPDHQGAILALDRLYQKEGMWADLADILRVEVEGASDAGQRIPLLLRLGSLYETALDDVPTAISTYKDVLIEQAEQVDAVAALVRLFEAGHERPQIGEILEPLYLERQDWIRLHGVLEALLPFKEPGDDRTQHLHRLAELCIEHLAEPERAFDWYAVSFKETPEDETGRKELSRLAAATDRYGDLVRTFTEGMHRTQDAELLKSLAHEMAVLSRTRLADDESAERMYRYILEIDPVDAAALTGLDELYVQQHRWPELVEVLRREISATYDEPQLLAFMYRLGQVYETWLTELDLAVEQYRGILEQEPHHAGALARLEQIYQAREEWEPLFDVLHRQSEVAERDAEKARLFARMAEIASVMLQRPDDAIDLWSKVLDLEGEDPTALRALEALYEGQERWRELVDVCDRQVNLPENGVDREIELFSKLGRVWGDYLDRERNALENWSKVLERDPTNEPALWAIRGLHERTAEFAELAQADHRLLDLLPGGDPRRVDLYRQLGELYQSSLENPEEAVRAWSSVLSLAPQDADAIDALEALHTASENWRACVEVLDRKAEITADAFDRISILFGVAEMWEKKIGEADGAKRAYAQILELQATNLDASQELERLYAADMQWEELVGLLLQRLETTTDPFDREELYRRTAGVFENRLDSVDNAFLVLSNAFEELKDDERLGAELERLAGLGEKWSELVQLYENVLHGMGHVPASVGLHLRVAGIYDRHLKTPEHAGTHYQYVLAIEPDNLKALDALQNLLERYNKWPEVVAVLQRRAELSTEPDERKAALERMARILEERLERPDAAIDAWRQVQAIDDTELPTLQALERLYAVRERWQDLINILVRQTQVIYDAAQIVENHLRIGELYEGRLGQPERAIDAYRQALSVDDRCLDAMTALEKLYTSQDRWRDLLDVFEMMLNVKTEPGQQLAIYGRIALIQEEELGDRSSTIDTYRKMLMVDAANVPAVRSLERLYRDAGLWHDLADVYRLHLEALTEDRARVATHTLLAALYQGPLSDPYAAIDTLTPILEIDSRHLPTLTALGELYAQVEDWPNCIDALSREAHLLTERPLVLDRQYRVGRVYEEKVGDLDQAERWYKSALEHDPAYLPALQALKGVHEQRAEWGDVVRTLKMIEAATKSFPEKAKSLFEIGQVYEKYLGDRGAAIDYYEQSRDMHDNVEAAVPLVEVYWEDRRWERAEPLLDLIVQHKTGANADVRELQTLNYRVGYVAEQLHKDEKALTHYKAAYELDSTHLPTLQGMGNLLFRREDWDRAFKIYQTILVHHRENLSEADVVEIFYRQGQIKLKVGERRKALDFFKKALDLEPRNEAVLRAVVDLHEKQGDWEDVIHHRRQMLALDLDANDRFQSLVTIGDILREHLRNVPKAVEAYKEALTVQSDSRLVLSKLLDLYQEARQWNEAVDILTRLAELERDAARQSKYYYTIGVIQRDELKDNFLAVRTLDKALDADPAMLKAFQAIDQILTNERDYERQDRYYRKMLKRAMESKLDDKLVITLAKGLGEINRTRLKKYDEAIKAYKIALTKSPEDLQVHTIVAELFELNEQPDKAIAEHYKMIELNPRNVESYQQVRRLFMESGRYDEAWCVCQVLSYLGHANADERAFFEKYRSKTLAQARKPLDNEQWGLIYHPELSLLLAQFFQRLWQYTVPLMAQQHKDLKLHKKKDLVEPTEQTPFNNVLNYVTQVTRLHRVEVYRIPEGGNGILSANLNPPGMMVGGDILSGRSMQELAFICSKQLMMMGQHFYTATIDPTYERRKARLSTIVYTVMKLVNPAAEVPFKDDDLLESFRGIPAADLQEISKLIAKMSENQQQHLNLSKWLEMIEHSSNRLGFVLSNDLGAAVRCLKNEPGQFSKAPVQDRVRELVLYALSENYFKLRKALGLAIG